MVSKLAVLAVLACLVSPTDARGTILGDLTDSSKVTHNRDEAVAQAKHNGATDPNAFISESKKEK